MMDVGRTSEKTGVGPGPAEFIALMASVMSLTALGIDLMLPAFGDMRLALGLAADSNATAGLVTAYFVGLAVPQLLYGALADRFGRKPVLIAGVVLYALGAIGSSLAPNLTLLLVARFIWGCGAAGTRVVSVAIIRDVYQGALMARAMSTIMAVFILVPVVAPSAGAALLAFTSWRGLFVVCAGLAVAVGMWSQRLAESWPADRRKPLRWATLGQALVRIAKARRTVGYSAAMTCMFGAFVSYLASSELIISEIFGRGAQFPIIFGVVAAVLGAASLGNGRVVGRFGLHRAMMPLLGAYIVAASAAVAVSVMAAGRPDFWHFFPLLTLTLCAHMMLIPNMNALAMEPVGDVAGVASAVIGTVTTAGGAALGAAIDHYIAGTVTPVAVGLLVAAVFAAVAVVWTERGLGPAASA